MEKRKLERFQLLANKINIMKKSNSLKIIITSVALCGAFTSIATDCIFKNVSCVPSSCGLGCGPPQLGKTVYICQTTSDGSCCTCIFTPFTCQCTFGQGSGDLATSYQTPNANCEPDGNNVMHCVKQV